MRNIALAVPMFFALYVYVVNTPPAVRSSLNCRLLAPATSPPEPPPPRVAKITPATIATTMMTMTPNAIMVFRLIFGVEVGGEAGGGGGGGVAIVLFCIFIPLSYWSRCSNKIFGHSLLGALRDVFHVL